MGRPGHVEARVALVELGEEDAGRSVVVHRDELVIGAMLNIEIERHTRVLVDTVRDVIDERLEALQPLMRALLRDPDLALEGLPDSSARD